ncbi:shikimate kinase [Kocuria varians]|uniref:Shikimate kinase n=1 Tax=Kocuria varians TaxID=1272 RepID=A0A4Y4D4R2_KOCVA|nr:shikimate kinase [Kocuria varians]GEC98553.1 shikimate kinase [Kocuria varians]
MTGASLPVVLIGPMAAGKSHVARHMADHYGLRHVDTDRLIESRHGPIPKLFRARGEEEFRRIEAETVAEILDDPENRECVISLGGGAPMSPLVQPLLEGRTVAYLEVDLDTVRPRIRGNTTRPMLQPDPEARWSQILDERRETFERLATIHLDGRAPRSVAQIAHDLYTALGAPEASALAARGKDRTA